MERFKASVPSTEINNDLSVSEKLKLAAVSIKEKLDARMAELMERIGKNPHFQNLHERDYH